MDFRETRPLIFWEHMYGWLDGYGILFDPVMQSSIGVIPQWENGCDGQYEEGDFVVTACQQASKSFSNIDLSGIYVRPKMLEKAAERIKEDGFIPRIDHSMSSNISLENII